MCVYPGEDRWEEQSFFKSSQCCRVEKAFTDHSKTGSH